MTTLINENIQNTLKKGTRARLLLNNTVLNAGFLNNFAQLIVSNHDRISGCTITAQNTIVFDCENVSSIPLSDLLSFFNAQIYNALNSFDVRNYIDSMILANVENVHDYKAISDIITDPTMTPMLYSLEFVQNKSIVLYF